MKNILIYLNICFLAFACQNTNNISEETIFETISDSNPEQMESEEEYDYEEMSKITITKEWFPSKFKLNQIESNIYFVYNPNETPFFSSLDSDSIIENIAIGEKVKLISKTNVENTNKNDDVTGNLWEIEYQGKKGYINSNYLSYIPFGESQFNLRDFFVSRLHIVDSIVIHKNGFLDYMESAMQESEYFFENKLSLSNLQHYESSTEKISIPNTTVIQGFFLLNQIFKERNFYQFLRESIPKENFETISPDGVYSENRVRVVYQKNEINSIEFEMGDGCMEWFYIEKNGNGVLLTCGAGC